MARWSGTSRGSATRGAKWASARDRSRSGCGYPRSTCESCPRTCGSASPRAGRRQRGRPSVSKAGGSRGRTSKHATKDLLAGLATCAVCGRGLVVETSPRKRGRKPEYVCHRHRHNGTCPNTLRVGVEDMNEAVLVAIEEHALTPEAVEHVIQLTEQDDVRDRQDALERERRDVERRLTRLVEVLESGGEAASIVAKIRELEARGKLIDEERAMLRPVPRLAPSVIENRLAEWRRLCASRPRRAAPCSSGDRRAHHVHAARGRARPRPQCVDALRSSVHGHCRRAACMAADGRRARERGNRRGGYFRRRLRQVAGTRFDAAARREGQAAGLAVRFTRSRSRSAYVAFHRRLWKRVGVPGGIRTRVTALKGRRPRPLDDRDAR